MLMPTLALCLAVSLFAPPEARATDDPWDQTNGLYVGRAIGGSADLVTVEMRGGSLVVLAPGSVGLLSLGHWELVGPGGKGGDLQLAANGNRRATMTRAGKLAKAPRKSDVALRLRLWPERKDAVLCMTEPGSKATTIRNVPPPGATAPLDAGITCYELHQVSSLAPTVAPPPSPAQPDFECMRECRQQNMMRAVGPDVIDADCRAACTQR